MLVAHGVDTQRAVLATTHAGSTGGLMLAGFEVSLRGGAGSLLYDHPTLSSTAVRWAGLAVEDYSIPAWVIPRHEHVEKFLHVVLRGSVKYEVRTHGKSIRFGASVGTTFILPRATVDEVKCVGPTHRIAVAIHSRWLSGALDESAHENEIELTELWNMTDPHIMAVLRAMRTDLDAGSPAGRLYGESLAGALAVYLLNRYAVWRYAPVAYGSGLPGYRLKRVLDYIGNHLSDDLSLSELAAIACMSPHYFAELFRQSTGFAPHRYVLLQRIERAKRSLRDPKRSIIDAGLDAGFQNPSHFARVFRKFVGITPSRFHSEMQKSRRTLASGR